MDEDLFKQSMQDVTPLSVRKKVATKKPNPKHISAAERRFNALQTSAQNEPSHIPAPLEVKPIEPYAVLGMKKSGIQEGVYRKLRLGKYAIESRLDLHQKSVQQAQQAVLRCVQDCLRANVRCVLILPGKGARNSAQPAILKSHLVHWLTHLPDVQAFHTAQPKDGGSGAFYVLLRKSEQAKQANRERFNKGRV